MDMCGASPTGLLERTSTSGVTVLFMALPPPVKRSLASCGKCNFVVAYGNPTSDQLRSYFNCKQQISTFWQPIRPDQMPFTVRRYSTKILRSHFTGPKVSDSLCDWVHPWDRFLSLWKQTDAKGSLGIFNLIGDGNCRFYRFAVLGYSTDGHKKAGFLRIQEEMIAETTTNRATYHRLQGGEEEVVKIIDGLTMCTTETIVPPEKWLNKLLHGQILANAYSISLTFLFSLVSPLEGHSS
ncbi:hypothetical protein PSHT_00983 [Puccinia striiformis]|uniref:Uncharacterized protein n=1 Tax=Puccinia striiformis TaxID=27350 RepID=A0A2S4WLM8_9BASI|nr:hypothetical protein PSHT_00983 [Puccinia striiformis]